VRGWAASLVRSGTAAALLRPAATGARLLFVLVALLFAAPDPARALCVSSERRVFFVEFDEGSTKLDEALSGRLSSFLLPSIAGGRYVTSYIVLASGDIAEGVDWDNAEEKARDQDRRLGEGRSASIRAMLAALPEALRSGHVQATVRQNRQVFSAAEIRANPSLNARVRAGIAADIRMRAPRRKSKKPVPVC
jgi:hypothetical protein